MIATAGPLCQFYDKCPPLVAETENEREIAVMRGVLRAAATSWRYHIPVSGIRMLLLIAIGAVGGSSSAGATALTVSDVFLHYYNFSPSIIYGSGGETIGYGATSVVPNGAMGTTGIATTTNLDTGNFITLTVPFDPGPVDPDNFFGQFAISSNPSSNNNPNNLTGPWTITFQNAGATPASVSNTLSLQGGELPFVNSVVLTGTSATPTFSWNPPPNVAIDGYRIDITQNNLVSNVPPLNSGLVVATSL